jgi:hypothetical protein
MVYQCTKHLSRTALRFLAILLLLYKSLNSSSRLISEFVRIVYSAFREVRTQQN